MRKLFILLLLILFLILLFSLKSQGQSFHNRKQGNLYMVEMNVREVTIGREIICNTQQVIWGNSADTLGFYFNNKEIYFWEAKDKNLMAWIDAHQTESDWYGLKQDSTGERYYVRRHTPKDDKGAYLIVIVNALHGYPSYSFGFRFEVCSH